MKAVLWDLDGTLADSSEFHWQSWRDTMAAAGAPITHEQFLASFGQRNDAILSKWLGDRTSAERCREIGDAKEALYRRMIQTAGIKPLPGAAEWVARLHVQGWRQAIASSAPRANVEVMADVLGLRAAMGSLVSAEDVRHGKPAPDVFLAAASKLSVPPERCVVVEDAEAGIEAARRAGMRRVGVGRSVFPGADVSAVSLVDLADDTFDRLIG